MTTQADWQREMSKLILRLVQEVNALNPGIRLDGQGGVNLDPIILVARGEPEAVGITLKGET